MTYFDGIYLQKWVLLRICLYILGQIICSQHKEAFGALLRLSAKVVLLFAAQAIQNSPSKQRKTLASTELNSHAIQNSPSKQRKTLASLELNSHWRALNTQGTVP